MVHQLLRQLQRAGISLAAAGLLGWGAGWAAEPAALAELLRRADE